MSELYLIAHSVRGEAAFDVALRMECPHCQGHGDLNIADAAFIPCVECEEVGYWWIIPTSGHRAYPWWTRTLTGCMVTNAEENPMEAAGPMPPAWPDHYHTRASPKLDITSLFKVAPKAHITRRL